jgi:hypothetical protein
MSRFIKTKVWTIIFLLLNVLLSYLVPAFALPTPLPTDIPTYATSVTPFPAEGPLPFTAWPPLTEDGFLLTDEQSATKVFVYRDEKAGQWIYISTTLKVEIARYSGKFEHKNVVWFIADIRFKEPEHFRAFSADPQRPSRYLERPEKIARNNHVVYAQNGDFFSFRLSNKERVGLIIRNSKLLHENTYTHPVAKIPPLDELALYADGHVEMHVPGELSGEDYLNKGALDVLAFGPILIKDSVKDTRLKKSFTNREPRSAIGIIAPGHFVGIMVEGRNKRSAGASLSFVADRLLEKGCYEAYTLDGGQTAAMIFMGNNVMSSGIYRGYQRTRRQQDIVGIGIYEEDIP